MNWKKNTHLGQQITLIQAPAENSLHHPGGHSPLLGGQRDSGKSFLDREDSMSKGTKMVNSGRKRRAIKALNSGAEIVGLGWRDLI